MKHKRECCVKVIWCSLIYYSFVYFETGANSGGGSGICWMSFHTNSMLFSLYFSLCQIDKPCIQTSVWGNIETILFLRYIAILHKTAELETSSLNVRYWKKLPSLCLYGEKLARLGELTRLKPFTWEEVGLPPRITLPPRVRVGGGGGGASGSRANFSPGLKELWPVDAL